MKMNAKTKILQGAGLLLLIASLIFLIVQEATLGDGEITQWWILQYRSLVRINIAFIVLALISIWIQKTKVPRRLSIWRFPVLFLSLIFLGFTIKGCPCAVSYFQNTVLFLLGKEFFISFFVVFCVLLLLTYIYGKVWCGWICPLGALQEYLYLGRIKRLKGLALFRVFKTKTAQIVMRSIQLAAFVALIVLLFVKQMPWYCRFDPFKAIFSLSVNGSLMWTLVIVLIVSSLLIYRPFCKMFCPMGLVLNVVSMIPGAHRINIDEGCLRCKRCAKKCEMCAIRNNKVDDTCIHCGECLTTKCQHISPTSK